MNTTTSPQSGQTRVRALIGQFGRDLGYLLPLLFISTLSFSVGITLLLTSLGTVIIWIGIPIGVLTLWLARGYATLERARIRAMSGTKLTATYRSPSPGDSVLSEVLAPLRDAQMWRDLCHAIVTFPLAVASWSLVVTWIGTAIIGLGGPWWEDILPDDAEIDYGPLMWLEDDRARIAVGALALMALPFVARGLAALNALVGRALLAPTRRDLKARISRLEQASRAAAAAESSALRRIERDLHDGPQQHLVSLTMDIERAARTLKSKPAEARKALDSALELSAQALAELRTLSRGIAPPLLAERGLHAALTSLAERAAVPVELECKPDTQLPLGVETTVYFVVAEALTNVAKHAQATAATVTVTVTDGVVTVAIRDNGQGGASIAKGHGLAGLEQRVQGAGGSLTVNDAATGGTIITAEVPCG